MRAQIEAYENAGETQANISQEKYETIKKELEEVREDFERLEDARSKLETKSRYRKQLLREWEDYHRDNNLKPPEKKHSSVLAKRIPPHTLAAHGFPSDPPPPSYPETLITSSEASTSASPHRRDAPDVRSTRAETAQQQSSCSRDLETKEAADSVGMIETSDEATTLPESENGMLEHPSNQSHSPALKQVDTDGSSPIIVSERCLKRKKPDRRGAKEISIHKDSSHNVNTPSRTQFKPEMNEHLPTSPLQSSRFANRQGIASDSLDLDDVQGTLWTPKKRQRMAESRLKESAIAKYSRRGTPITRQNGAEDDRMPQMVEPIQRESSSEIRDVRDRIAIEKDGSTPDGIAAPAPFVDENSHLMFLEHGGKAHGGVRARKEAQKAEQDAHNQRIHSRLASNNEQHSASSKENHLDTRDPGQGGSKIREKPQKQEHIQTNSSPAHRSASDSLPQTNTPLTRKKNLCPPSRRNSRAAKVTAVAEDGDHGTPARSASTAVEKAAKEKEVSSTSIKRPTLKAPDAPLRLGNLLQGPSPPKQALVSADPAMANSRKSRETPTCKKPVKRIDNASAATPRSVPTTSKGRDSVADWLIQSAPPSRTKHNTSGTFPQKGPVLGKGPADTRPEHEPLRARPTHRLRLEDFKLNPNHSNYAYHETIRKHDDKKARAGCTDPFCQRCSELRKYAEMSGYVAPKQTGLFDSTPPDGADITINEKVLRDYLGSDAYRIPQMSAKEKAEAMQEANKKHFVDTYGKHKQTFSKPPEIPGFWMTEFPSTQENEQLDEEIRVIERRKVEERRQEALRGGMWQFADEVK